jgi:hypothetical protein
MTLSRSCCCGPRCIRDCIVGTEIEDGCCHHADTLVLWNGRPGYNVQQHYVQGSVIPGDPDCEVCYTQSQALMPPVQSIYKFAECRFVFRYAEFDQPVNLIELPTYNDIFGQGEACKNPCCHPEYDPDQCCFTTFPPLPGEPPCLCDTWFGTSRGGLSNSRKDDLKNNAETLWFIDMTCHKDGQPLAQSPLPFKARLYDQFLCLVFYERWWKIADCPAGVRIRVPGCTVSTSGSNCSGVPFQTDDLVPKWWIFACSGIPLYQCDLDDALSNGVIEADEYNQLMIEIGVKGQPTNQETLRKLADAGYIGIKDWRPEQRQAFIDLHARFPSAGYNLCIEDVEDMHTLGPFRKRFCDPTVGVTNRPYLHKDDVFVDQADLQAVCMKNYPGSLSNQDDYNYWRERQWVYFRGIPGGWQWVNWNAGAGTGLSELDAIAAGYGRNEGIGGPEILSSPLLAFRGEPRPNPICTPCSGVCPTALYCDVCAGPCTQCGTAPVAGCDPPEVCRKFSIFPECEGVRFVYSQYYVKNDLTYNASLGVCEAEQTYVCLYTVDSFLTEARRSRDSWEDEIPFTCRTEIPALPSFNAWPVVDRGHQPPAAMCNEIIEPVDPGNPKYTISDLCCSGGCTVYTECSYGGTTYGCPEDGPSNPCPARTDCAADVFTTPEQIACIGHTMECQEPT